jgi:mannosyltransferase OCH1-like enzyme
MAWFLRVPKVLHVYWGGGILPYMRYLTVKSFMEYNPEWEIILWQPQYPFARRTWTSWEQNYDNICDDYYQKLLDLPISKRYIDYEFFGFSNSMSEVHKSDFIRLYLLARYGGVWSDMDIIYFKSIENLFANSQKNENKDTFVCISHYGHSAGFMMSAPGSKYFKRLEQMTKTEFDPAGYQSIGPTMFTKYFPTIQSINKLSPAVNIGMDAVYSHDAMKIESIIDGTKASFTKYSIGLHWYAGHPQWGEFIKNTNGGLTNLPECIIGNLLR